MSKIKYEILEYNSYTNEYLYIDCVDTYEDATRLIDSQYLFKAKIHKIMVHD